MRAYRSLRLLDCQTPISKFAGEGKPSIIMSITIRDVARKAGVSTSTVSRVLNDSCPVAEGKRRRVLDAVGEMGYSPNPAARSLLGKRTGAIGVLLPFVGAEFFSDFLTGLDEAVQANDFFLIISTSHRHFDEFRAAMQAMDKRVDGMIVMAPELNGTAGLVSRGGRRLVLVNTYVEDESYNVINFDNYGGSFQVTSHLLEAGHRDIAIIKGPAEARDARERTRGFRAAMAEYGIDNTTALEYQGEFTQEAGYLATRSLLSDAHPRPTAIVCANDYCAMGALLALNEAGLAIPQEMAVVGFDGITSGRYTQPSLTSVRVPMRAIGKRAVERLLELIETEDEEPQREVVPVSLVLGGSTN
jgi:LacI family transcriptional regulator